ncbi:beta strand repeat-containing protein [Turneriella parva]|uniref:Fibronectin type III domain protein n=1 Tax=Turneriella parva (strain ATCC BAA-1111 / DSM 21527 / NCTC 11395 / H) TaxID=869212 RepID=I4B9D5_TURPD|nr:Ig-like domain-containing protein [Turneriella parva]AFM13892.1 Fibronectin type III domain protein [Turneriella parva DSM 21527]
MKKLRHNLAMVLVIALFAAYCGGRTDNANNAESGITGSGIVNTPSNDTTSPTVSSYSPVNGGTLAANAVLISVTFSEPMNVANVTTSSFHVKNGNNCTGTQLTSAAPVASNSNQTFTITLNASQLIATQQYSTCVTGAITDVAGNALTAALVSWTASAVDNTPPANVTGFTVQPALGRLVLSWTNPADSDFAGVRILRKTTNDITDQSDATATVACSGNLATPQATCNDTGLTDGTTYYYKIFTYDAVPNYNSGVNGSGTPACGTIEDIKTQQGSPTTNNTRYSLSACTLPQVTVTSVHRDGSNMGFNIQQTQSGAGIFVFTGSVNPTTTLNLTPGDRITFAGAVWANLCVASFNQQLQIVKKTAGSICDGSINGFVSEPFTAGDFTEGSANANYLANLGTTVSGNVTFSTDFVNGADGRLYVFTTPVTITGALASGVYPASFGGSTTINVTNTALAASLLANGIVFTPGRAVMGRFSNNLELRIYGTGAGGTTNYDGVTSGGGENGFGIKNLTYTVAPTISFFSPANGGGFNTASTQVSVGFDQAITTATVTSTSFKVVAGTDCAAAALATTGGITNSNAQKTFTLTLTGGQLVDGNQYTTCVTTAVQNTSSLALATASSASWRASTQTSNFANFESWATANQPTGWVYGTPPSGGGGVTGSASTNITQDTTSPVEGTRGANITTAATSANGNVLSYATNATPLAGTCSRLSLKVRGTSTGRSFAIQLQTAGGTAANYCSIGNDQLATSISTATTIEPASASYTQTDINTGGAWMTAVCRIDNLAGGSMDTFRIRWGNPAAYNLTFDDIQFLDNANNPCVPIDTAPPTVSTVVPASAATGIAFAPSASVTFNKAMNVASVNGAYTVKETNCSGTTVSTGTPTASGGNTIFTYALTTLKPLTTYAHCVTTGATSSAGTALAADYSATWTTTALTEPTGVTATPSNTQVSIAFTVGNGNGGVKIVGQTGSSPADCTGTALYTGSTSPYVHTGLTNGTQYYYRVCSTHNTGAYLSTGVTATATPSDAFNVNSAVSTGNTTATVTFSAAPNQAEAETPGNYEVVLAASSCGTGAVVAVSAASRAGSVVTLTTAAQTASTSYKVCVSGVTRSSDGALLATSPGVATFTGTGAGPTPIAADTDITYFGFATAASPPTSVQAPCATSGFSTANQASAVTGINSISSLTASGITLGCVLGVSAAQALPAASTAGNFSAGVTALDGTVGPTVKYLQFVVDISAGYSLKLKTFRAAVRVSGTGPGNLSLYYSVDGYASAIGSISSIANTNFNQWTSDLSAVPTIDGPATVTFRVAPTNTTSQAGGTIASTGVLRLDELKIISGP